MASYPPSQSQRRATPQQSQSEHSSTHARRNSSEEARSVYSIDSQTIFLDPPSSSSNQTSSTEKNTPNTSQQQQQQQQPDHNTNQTQDTSDQQQEPKKCWICFSDSTEDTPSTSPWRTPCPCALTAHESCLLDWIADIENPSNNNATTASSHEIKCPQCKSQIYLARPQSNLVEAVSMLENVGNKLLLPTVVAGVGHLLIMGCSHHGAHAVRQIFGDVDSRAILSPVLSYNWLEKRALQYFPSIAGPILRNWRGIRVEVGLPLIPAALVASRTNFADALLPILPILFFATHPISSRTLRTGYWPPSAALTLVTLPYIRSAYDHYLESVWGEHERNWVREVRPRLGDGEDDGNGSHTARGPDNIDGEEVIEIRVGIDTDEEEEQYPFQTATATAPAPQVGDRGREQFQLYDYAPHEVERMVREGEEGMGDWLREDDEGRILQADGEEIVDPQEAGELYQRLGEENRERHQEAEQGQNQAQGQGQEGEREHQHQFEGRFDLLQTAHTVADTIIGALLFPMISSASGELFKLLLPYSWTSAPRMGGRWGGRTAPTGLLQTKWGRSIVGGCLFVVLKDAIRIYCRWRMAVSFRERKVRDWDKKNEKLV